jgi:hypothetical protein
MPVGDACLLDSNILLRISKSDDPQQAVIGHALRVLAGRGVRLCYTSQTLGGFWNASTRPFDKNGFGLTVAETDRLARVIERDFDFRQTAAKSPIAGDPCLLYTIFKVYRSTTPDWRQACMSTASGRS